MAKTPRPMQSEDKRYVAMANALKDPRRLRQLLLSRRRDVKASMVRAQARKDQENMQKLSAALTEIDEALEQLMSASPRLVKAEEEALLDEGAEAEDSTEDEVEPDVETEDEDAGEVDEPPESDGSEEAEPGLPDDDEPEEPENPVAMTSKLRKEMGDSSADFLDDYGLAIHKKVMSFFESLMTKALDLGTDDESDGKNSLREVLRDEVGKRGVRRIEPVFEEWRAAVIKQISKDVAAMFQPPEPEPEPQPEATEPSPEAATEAAETAPAEEQEPSEEPAEEAEEGTPATASANNTPLVSIASGRVSFAVKASTKATDFRPSGFTPPRLS